MPKTAGLAPVRRLWYAAVFPQLVEPALLQRLCLHAQQFTSFVSLEPPNALLLEVKGSLKLFGPLEALHSRIDACWRGLGLQALSATAPSTLAALWLARGGAPCGDAPSGDAPSGGSSGVAASDSAHVIADLGLLAGQLAKLPIGCTAWDGERLQTLCAMGVRRVGDLLRLPRDGLARRLGTGALEDLDIALARQFAPRRAFVPRERFRERCDFEVEVEHAAYLEKAAEPVIARCARFLRERQAGVQGLHLKLKHRTAPATQVRLGLASVTGEHRRLMDVLAQQLARLELPAPVRGLELISGSLRPLSAVSLDAFVGSSRGGRDTAPQLVERLRARLGEEAVYGVASIPEHRPEAAWRRVHELNPAVPVPRGEAGPGIGMPRPVWLLESPLPLTSGLILEEGPERIESGWWDGRGVARDYYVARQAGDRHRSGAKLWVFQERESKHWYLHGVFA